MDMQKNIENSVQEEQPVSKVQEGQSQANESQQSQSCNKLSLVVSDKANNVEIKYALEDGKEIIVGASPECSVIVGDPYISGKHFSIRFENGRVQVKDLGSKNGLYLKLDESAEILPGQVLLAGKTIFTLEEGGDDNT